MTARRYIPLNTGIPAISSSPTTGAIRPSSNSTRSSSTPTGSSPTTPTAALPSSVRRSSLPQPPRKRSRAGALTVGALAIAVVSAGIGGGVALMAKPDTVAGGTQITAAPSMPAASLPAGSVEQVASKVVPSVVKLETDLGRASEEGSGIILSSDGLILTNNHVVAGGKGGDTTVTFADGRTSKFTVVGTDPSSDIAVIKADDLRPHPDHHRLVG